MTKDFMIEVVEVVDYSANSTGCYSKNENATDASNSVHTFYRIPLKVDEAGNLIESKDMIEFKLSKVVEGILLSWKLA